MYTALITDFDGTVVKLCSGNSQVDDSTVKVVQQAIKSGKKIACATGREWALAKIIIDRLQLQDPCIIEGGARIVDPKTGQTIWGKHLEFGSPNKILQVFKSNSTGDEFIVSSDQPINRLLSEIDSLPDDLSFVYLIGASQKIAKTICHQISLIGGTIAHINPSWQGKDLVNIHVTHKLADKGQAIKIWQEMMNISQTETIGLGDSNNDIPLLGSTGFKVAVSNASNDLKSVADYIAPNDNNNALRDVIEGFLLA